MDYINGKPAGNADVRQKEVSTSDSRLYLSETTWEELEKYLKSIKPNRNLKLKQESL